jgi:D-tyrosyl-tRNA(Tyr) deacylase
MVGLQKGDTDATLDWMVDKLMQMRIFADAQGKMNLCVAEVESGGVLLVPNFTVGCEIGKGRRPSFDEAMPPAAAGEMFASLVEKFSGKLGNVQAGVFGAHMRVHMTNDGPVTFILESRSQ